MLCYETLLICSLCMTSGLPWFSFTSVSLVTVRSMGSSFKHCTVPGSFHLYIWHLYVRGVHSSGLSHAPMFQKWKSNCLLDIYTWLSLRQLKFYISKTEPLLSSPLHSSVDLRSFSYFPHAYFHNPCLTKPPLILRICCSHCKLWVFARAQRPSWYTYETYILHLAELCGTFRSLWRCSLLQKTFLSLDSCFSMPVLLLSFCSILYCIAAVLNCSGGERIGGRRMILRPGSTRDTWQCLETFFVITRGQDATGI